MRWSVRITAFSFSSVSGEMSLLASTGVSVSAITTAPVSANAYVHAIGEKMTPETPVIVKSGMNATAKMTFENAIGPTTSRAPAKIRSFIVPRPWLPRWRKMFSMTMTVLSTTIPKSTAPIEMRFVEMPVVTSPMNATRSAMGMLIAVMSAARVWPRKTKSTTATSPMPSSRFSSTVCVVSFTRLPRS